MDLAKIFSRSRVPINALHAIELRLQRLGVLPPENEGSRVS
jgi:hypothetical protein